MSDASAADQLREIESLLDHRVGRDGVEDLTVVERIADVVTAFETWSDLAIRRLHEIHRLTGNECEFCDKWLADSDK